MTTKTTLNSLGDLDLTHTDLLKNCEISEDSVRPKLTDLCGRFLSDVWSRVSTDQLIIERIGGLHANPIYSCSLPDGFVPEDQRNPRRVAVRLYTPKWFDYHDNRPSEHERSIDSIVVTVMSERRIGAKCYGVCEVGEVWEYVESRPFYAAEENDPAMVKKLAEKLAQIHCIDMPVEKKNNYFKTLGKFLNKAYEMKLEKKIDLKGIADEIEFIKREVEEWDPPTVFCHNEFRNTNIMVRPDNQVVICDFEHSAYGYRCQDVAWLFYFWGKSNFILKYIQDKKVLRLFLEAYIEECGRIKGEAYKRDPKNSLEHLVKETKLFYLVECLFMILFMLKLDEEFIKNSSFENIFNVDTMRNYAKENWKKYFEFKQKIIEEGIIKV